MSEEPQHNRRQGDLEVKDPTEFDVFRQELAAMNEALLLSSLHEHELREAAERTNKRLREEIAERQRAQEALREASLQLESRVQERTAELDHSNQELQGFTYSMAHDLRAPLRTVISTSRILQKEAPTCLSAEHVALLERQVVNASRLSRLIDDLLEFARLSQHPFERKPLDVTSIAKDVSAALASGDSVHLPEVVVEEGLVAEGDPAAVWTVLQNLIENAAKFSPNGGTIFVGRQADGDQAFFVRDQGIGFSMLYADKIFKAFERLVGESEFPGNGIGLANVKRIVERHNGKIWAQSIEGHGATFFFTLGNSVKTAPSVSVI